MALGQNIKRLRKAQGLSQDQLAAKAGGGITQGIIAALEKRDSETSKHAARIAAALGVSVDALLTGEGSPAEKSAVPAPSCHRRLLKPATERAFSCRQKKFCSRIQQLLLTQ